MLFPFINRGAALFVLGLFLGTSATADEPKPRTASVTTLRSDGVMLVNGKPVIPRGFYISSGHTGAIRTRCVELMAECGFNAVHIEGPWHEDTTFLDRAAELGIHVIAGHTESEDKLWRVREFKDHPAIVAWTIYDDANINSNVTHLRKMNGLIKAIAPGQLTYIPISTQSRTEIVPPDAFFECSDIVGWEDYPIARRPGSRSSVRNGELEMSRVAPVAAKHHRPVWILPQSFAWPGQREPTPAEFRNLCYVGLANNAKGVMPWAIYYKGDDAVARSQKRAKNDPDIWDPWFLPDHPVLWEGCKAVASELRILTPILIDGRFARLDAVPDASAACWQVGETLTVVVASVESARPIKVSIPVPGGPFNDPKPLFPGRPTGLKLIRGKLEGDIDPVEVHIYQMSTRQPVADRKE
jgi:hypothetical protein